MDELARKQTSTETKTGLVSFSHFGTELVFVFPGQVDGQESVTVSLQSACFPNSGWELDGGCVDISHLLRMRPVSSGTLSLVRGALLATGLLKLGWIKTKPTANQVEV